MIDADLLRGRTAEKVADRYLRDRHGALEVWHIDRYYPEFDLVALFPRGKIRSIEVKLDEKEKETGNIAIEYIHQGQFSGILVSQADWYIIVLTDKLLCMKKRELFYFLRENPGFKEIKWEGDKSTILLVPTDELVASGICDIWDYNKKQVVEKEAPRMIADYA